MAYPTWLQPAWCTCTLSVSFMKDGKINLYDLTCTMQKERPWQCNLLIDLSAIHFRTSVSLSANHLVLVELPGKNLQRWLNDASPESQHQMKCRLCINIYTLNNAVVSLTSEVAEQCPECSGVPFTDLHVTLRLMRSYQSGFDQQVKEADLSGCCSRPRCGHPQAAFQRRSVAAGQGECLHIRLALQ